jgi:hypothetical protein
MHIPLFPKWKVNHETGPRTVNSQILVVHALGGQSEDGLGDPRRQKMPHRVCQEDQGS